MLNELNSKTLFDINECEFIFNQESNQEVEDINEKIEQGVEDISLFFSHNFPTKIECSASQEENIHDSTNDNISEDLTQVPFVGKNPNLNFLASLIRDQIDQKGIDFVVEK